MTHRWKVYRSGGVDQVALSSRDDLIHLASLDPKLWVALSMPTSGVHVDRRTLALLDTDHDGYVRRPEVLAAVAWMCSAYRDPGTLFTGGDTIALDQIADGPILRSARRLLVTLGKPDARSIAISDVAEATAMFAHTLWNGDGVIPAEAVEGDARAVIEDIIATRGSVPDRSGKPGVDQERIAAFFAAVRARIAWHDGAGIEVATLAAAAAAIAAVEVKVDDFFTRCRLAKFDARAQVLLAPDDAALAALAGKTLSLASPEVADLPLARIAADGSVPLDGAVNPAWQARIAALAHDAVAPLLGAPSALDEAAWTALVARIAPFRAWQATQPADAPAATPTPPPAGASPGAPSTPPVVALGALGEGRLRAALAHEAEIEDALARDLAVKPEADSAADVEKLCYLHRDLGALLANYVNFAAFYSMRGAVFQAGTLFLDARACSLVFEVVDPVKHATLGPMSGTYLAYCDCTREGVPKKTIAATLTAGDVDNLFVGRNGVFVDRDGKDWQATITKLIDNPISIRQAFWSPYKKTVRAIEERIAKRAAVAATESQTRLDDSAAIGAEAGKPAEQPKKAIDVGTVAALGVAVGGIAAAVAAILSGIFGLGKWAPLGVAGILLAVSAPSTLLAYMKLRRRNLGPLLDANGWAINVLTRINIPFGTALTERAALPPNAERSLRDPYAEIHRPWRLYLVLVVIGALVVAWWAGSLDPYLPGVLTSKGVLGSHAYKQ